MADYETLFPGRFLKSVDLAERDATVTIKTVVGEEIDGKQKVIITFEGTKKQFVCNRTNAEAIRLIHGRELNDWLGKRITLGRVMMKDPFGGDDAPDIGALRVKGSPDLAQAITAEVKRGRKTLKISVKPTGGKPATAKPATNGKVAAPAKPAASSEPTDEEKEQILENERASAAADGLPS